MCERTCDGGHIQMANYAKQICDHHGFFIDESSGGDIVIRPDHSRWIVRDVKGKKHDIFADRAEFRFKNTHSLLGFFSGWDAHADMFMERERLAKGDAKKKVSPRWQQKQP